MQVPPPHAAEKPATEIVVGPVSAVFAVFAQSTWNFQRRRLFVPYESRKFGEPDGGGVDPSRSEGNRLPYDVLSWTHCCVAACPDSILARSYAHTSGPSKLAPFLKRLNVA